MGKKKPHQTLRSESTEEAVHSKESDDEMEAINSATKIKKKVKNKRKADLDVSAELEQMTLEQQSSDMQANNNILDNNVNGDNLKKSRNKVSKKQIQSSDDGEEEEVKVTPARRKYNKFAALAADDMADEDDEDDKDEEEETVKVPMKGKFSDLACIADDDMMVDLGGDDDDEYELKSEDEAPQQAPPTKQNKKCKDKKTAVIDDWNDLDELGTPSDATGKKKKNKKDKKREKKNKLEDDEEDFDKLLAEARLADGVTASLQAEPQTEEVKEEANENPDVKPDDSKSKRKRKKKGKGDAAQDDDLEVLTAVAVVPEGKPAASAVDETETNATEGTAKTAVTEVESTVEVSEKSTPAVLAERRTPAEVTEKHTTAEIEEKPTPAEVTEKHTTAEIEEKPTPAEVTEKHTTAEIEEKRTPAEVIEKSTPAEVTEKPTPAEVTEKSTPAEVTEKPTPAEVTEKPTPAEVTEKPTPAEVTEKPTPAEVPLSSDAVPAVTLKSGQDSGTVTPADATQQAKSKKQKKKESEEEKKRRKEEEEEKKLKKKEEEEEKKRAKKGIPNKKILAAMKELQQKQKEEEEARKREEEELAKQEDERIRLEEEKRRQEEERKERKKQKEKERKERLKAEGKYLTAKQKAEQRRAQEMLEYYKAQGLSIPEAGEKKAPRLGSKAFAKKKTQLKQDEVPSKEEVLESAPEPPIIEEATLKEEDKKKEEEGADIKESWDLSSDEDEEENSAESASKEEAADNTAEESSEGDEDAEDEEEEEKEDEAEVLSAREKVLARLAKRRETNEANRHIETLRAPVVCVLGHVDHGKTKILDKLRRTNVQEGEVGGITQQIGATNVPAAAIAAQTKMVKTFDTESLHFPGLLIIDTPGHESFSNLRNRGSSLCDIAILVVDITQGLEPQTIESIDMLKKRKTPFLVALNKVDRVFEWESNQHKDIREVIKSQKETAKNDFDRRTKDIILKLNEQGMNAALFYENPDPRSYVSLVPTSAISGDGMGNLIALICDMCQTKLATQLRYSEELQCTVLEVKTIQGHGTTIDVILVNGRLREGDTIVLAGTDAPIVTQIRSLLLPKPMKEIRVKGAYDEFKEVQAAQGVKVAAKDLERAIAGLSLRVAEREDEVELLKDIVDRDFKQAMRAIKVKEKGVYVQASTLGALEALLEFFKTKSIPYSGIRVGPVVKRDVMRAAAQLEHDEKYAVILAFDVRVERDAQELADREGVKIFSEETIYHLGDRYVEYLEDHKRRKQDENRSLAIFPCKLKILPTAIFNKRDPIVLGVTVDAGVLRTGTLLCVPAKEFVEIGVVSSMEFDHKVVDIAKKGVDVCIKIDPSQGTTPKLYGRHFEAPDEIVSKISRESINACKEFFRDDLTKTDWKLMAELKKLFEIL